MRHLLGFILLSFFFVFPVSVNANIFSYLSSFLFSNNQANQANAAISLNSQTVPLLRAALNIDPNPSKGGGGILIVGGASLLSETGPSGTIADIEEKPATSDQISVYVVREGDTLSQIARMFRVSVNTIRWANNIHSSKSIHEGQTLVILPISGVRHTVKKGDTLKSITKKYEGDLADVLSYNNLTKDSALVSGDVIVIPNGEISTPKSSVRKKKKVSRSSSNNPTYKGYYIRPVNGIRTQGIHGYNAVDIGAPRGTPIVASASGDVIVSRATGWNGGYGTYIVIKHSNGTQTLYAHNSRNIVYTGNSVIQGQVIGYVGSTGRSTGPHVHFEVRGASNPF